MRGARGGGRARRRYPRRYDRKTDAHVSEGRLDACRKRLADLGQPSVARRLSLPVLAKFVAAATIGVPPRVMGVGPTYTITAVLKKTGL